MTRLEATAALHLSHPLTAGNFWREEREGTCDSNNAGQAHVALYAENSVTVTVEPSKPPFTASTRDVAATHDGSSTFTFEVLFSEELHDDFSYKTLQDHAFTVTEGEVVKARRLVKFNNARWEISVRPDSNGAVTIVLPPTTGCEADGAICTDDGRMLYGRLEPTVAGPGG